MRCRSTGLCGCVEREALKQVRPPTLEEQHATRTKQVSSRVQGFLASLKGGVALPQPFTASPVFRNKKDAGSDSDDDLLRFHQEDLDDEGER